MEKPFIESWQESSKSWAGLFRQFSDKNVALSHALYSNLASKQWAKMTQAALDMTMEVSAAGNGPDFSRLAASVQFPTENDIQAFKEFIEIYQAAFERIGDSQSSLSKSYIDLLSAYAENLDKSRDIDDVVATNFDYLNSLLMMAKSAALDSLEIGESIKTALAAWTENSFKAPAESRDSSIH